MDRTALETFLAVAETGSFSATAERMGLTQPAVSKRVQALEQQVGHRLFDRVGRRSHLTEAGRVLLPAARRILRGMREAQDRLAGLSGTVAGVLRLASSHHVGLHRLPAVLRRFGTAHPDVELDLSFLDSEQGYERVRTGAVDLAVVTLAPRTLAPLRARPVWQDPLVYCAAADHPLAAPTAAPLELGTLARWPALLPGPGTYTGRLVLERFARRGLEVRTAMSTNYLETIRRMVSIGLGWSVLPEGMLDEGIVRLPLRSRDEAGLTRTLGYVVHQELTRSGPAAAFIAALEGDRAPGSGPGGAGRNP